MVFAITSKNVDITPDEGRGCVWKQYLLSFVVSFPFFTQGVQTIALSTSVHSGHFITPAEVPWSTTALILSAAVSAPLYSFIIDRWGRKFGLYLIIMLQGVSCIPLLLSLSEATVISLHVIAGVVSGGLFTVLPVYIREICADQIRAAMVSLMALMTSAGYLMKLVMTEECLLYTMAGLVMFQFLVVFLVIESPSYLVMKGDLEGAKTSLAKLRCVRAENQHMIDVVTELKEESERARAIGKLNVMTILKNPIWRDATKLGITLCTVTVLSGSIVFLDQEKALMQLRTEEDPDQLLVPVCLCAGGAVAVVFMRFMERKYFLTFAYSAMVLSMGVLAVYTQDDLTVTQFRRVPFISLGVLVFSYGMAWGVPFLVMVEILNIEIRATILGCLYTYSQLLKLAHVHSFNYLEEHVGIYTLFYIFACLNLFGAVYSISKLPDVKCKSVKQVERQLKRIPLLQFNTIPMNVNNKF